MHCHGTSSVEGIAMEPHLYGILTAVVVQEHLYSFLNLHLLVHLLVRQNELLCLGAVTAKGSEGERIQ